MELRHKDNIEKEQQKREMAESTAKRLKRKAQELEFLLKEMQESSQSDGDEDGSGSDSDDD